MALNPACEGRVYPTTEPYEVGREKIWEYAQAIRDDNPAYRDPDYARSLGHPDVIAPPSFPMIISLEAERQVVLDPELGARGVVRFVHREQRFAYNRPIHANDVLTVQVRIAKIEAVGANDVISFESRIEAAGGEHVCTARSTFVAFDPDNRGAAAPDRSDAAVRS
jgi:acyl dehydratase